MTIPGLRGMNPIALVRQAMRDFSQHDMLTLASALAFQALFSLFPFVLFLTALLGFLHLTQFVEWVQVNAVAMLPAEAAQVVNDVVAGLQQQDARLLSFGAVVALWSASAAVRMVMHASNRAFNVAEARPAWKRYPLSVLYTIALALMLVAAAVLMNLGPGALEWIARHVGLGDLFVAAWAWLRWPAAFLLLILAASMIYWAAPNVTHDFRLITPGAMLSISVWVLASLGFNYYVKNFADYNAMYGSIGAVIALLTYFFISSAVLLFGAEVNAVVQRHAPVAGDARPQPAD